MPNLYFDFGNADAKWFTGGAEKGFFKHALAALTESQWLKAVGHSKTPPPGYIAIEGHYFAVGRAALRQIILDKPKGAERYVAQYYGVALAYAIGEAYDPGTRVINLFGSHAPGDISYATDLKNAAKGQWKFVNHKGEYSVNVASVDTFDEPLGGFYHYVLTKEGKARKQNPYRESTVLVLDVGGHTTDVVAIDPGGEIDVSSLRSVRTGAQDTFEWFERELRDDNKELFKNTRDIHPPRLEAAILSGKFKFGNREIDCAEIATQSLNTLVNDIRQIISGAGGVANYDAVLLTGGGSALVYDQLSKAERDIDFVMVEKYRDDMRFANVYGGANFYTLLKAQGII